MDPAFDFGFTTTTHSGPASPASLHQSECGSSKVLLPDPKSRERLRGRSSTENLNLRIVSQDLQIGVYYVSVDGQTTSVLSRRLETSLPGRLLLSSFTGTRSWKLWDLLFPREWGQGDFRIAGTAPSAESGRHQLMILGGAEPLEVSWTVLEQNWVGRLFIIGWTREGRGIVAYIWQDINAWFQRVAARICEFWSRV